MKKIQNVLWGFLVLWGSFISVAYGQSGDVEEISGGTRFLVSSGGSSAGNVATNKNTGAATYSFQLPVPPARGAIKPQILLNYDSQRQNPNSWVGKGWELHMGFISRVADDGQWNYRDGKKFQASFGGKSEELVWLDRSDPLSHYGVLRPQGIPAGAKVDAYRSRLEGAFNIYFHFHEDDEDYGWLVVDKGGSHYRFGAQPGGHGRYSFGLCEDLVSENCPQITGIQAWYLENVTDVNANELNIAYASRGRPQEISYQDIRIVFTEENLNWRQLYAGGSRALVSSGVLDIIEVFQNDVLLQKFKLTYHSENLDSQGGDTWGGSLLSEIKQFGKSDNALPSTVFDYNRNDLQLQAVQNYEAGQAYTTSFHNQSIFLGLYSQMVDMNGDGLVDRVIKPNERGSQILKVLYNTGSDFEEMAGRSEWHDPFHDWECADNFPDHEVRDPDPYLLEMVRDCRNRWENGVIMKTGSNKTVFYKI